MTRGLLIVLGWISLALGTIGVFLPILPTTPFVILAASLFARSSPKLHRRLLDSPFFGPILRDWESHGVIRLPTKLLATAVILLSFTSMTLYAPVHWGLILALDLLAAAILAFIWSRPS